MCKDIELSMVIMMRFSNSLYFLCAFNKSIDALYKDYVRRMKRLEEVKKIKIKREYLFLHRKKNKWCKINKTNDDRYVNEQNKKHITHPFI